jgi:predicted ester cyclase
MSSEDNIIIVRRFVDELWNDRNLKVADEIFASECLTHQLRSDTEISSAPRDPDTLKKHVSEWLTAFPDLHFTLEQTVAGDDRVASQISMSGTHKGEWMGISPTGKQVRLRMLTIHRIVDGKIVEDWVLVDSLGFFQQLGLVPSREEILAR